jgi:UDP-glucose 4-epimerase
MNNIIVTGGAGFIGSHCVDLLIKRGHHVLILDDLSFGKEENLNPKADFIKMNISDFETTEEIIADSNPSHIFHFAADATTKSTSMGWKNPLVNYKINMVGTLNVLESIRKRKLSTHLIYASTAAVYGEPDYVPIDEKHVTSPLSPYGVSKLAGEKYCYAYFKEYAVKTTIVRIFNTYGPRQPRYVMFDQMKKMLTSRDGTFHVLGTGEQLRDYAYVSDSVDAFYRVMTQPEKSIGQVFNVAGGNKFSIKDLIVEIKSVLRREALEEVFTGESWKGDLEKLWADTSKIREVLGWEPKVRLREGLELLADWIKENRKN